VIYAGNFFVIFKNKNSGLFEEIYAVDMFDPPMPPSKLEKSITSYVFRTGEPLLLTDEIFELLVSQGEVELVGTNSASWLGAALKTPGETIGVMAVQNYEQRDCYTESDRDFFAFVALQVSLLLERKMAEEQIRNQMETQGALYDLTRKLVGLDDFTAILDLVTRSTVESVHVTFACFLILEQDELVLQSVYPIRELDEEIKLDQRRKLADHPFCKRALNGNEPIVLENDNPEAGEFVSFFSWPFPKPVHRAPSFSGTTLRNFVIGRGAPGGSRAFHPGKDPPGRQYWRPGCQRTASRSAG
jgi:transcriptional regulator with GAF, ATPase, and Fis domain